MISDETRPKVDSVREMMRLGINIQATGDATNAIISGAIQALLDHIDEIEADLKTAVALGKAYANIGSAHQLQREELIARAHSYLAHNASESGADILIAELIDALSAHQPQANVADRVIEAFNGRCEFAPDGCDCEDHCKRKTDGEEAIRQAARQSCQRQ